MTGAEVIVAIQLVPKDPDVAQLYAQALHRIQAHETGLYEDFEKAVAAVMAFYARFRQGGLQNALMDLSTLTVAQMRVSLAYELRAWFEGCEAEEVDSVLRYANTLSQSLLDAG
jgi:hypothetical protein